MILTGLHEEELWQRQSRVHDSESVGISAINQIPCSRAVWKVKDRDPTTHIPNIHHTHYAQPVPAHLTLTRGICRFLATRRRVHGRLTQLGVLWHGRSLLHHRLIYCIEVYVPL